MGQVQTNKEKITCGSAMSLSSMLMLLVAAANVVHLAAQQSVPTMQAASTQLHPGPISDHVSLDSTHPTGMRQILMDDSPMGATGSTAHVSTAPAANADVEDAPAPAPTTAYVPVATPETDVATPPGAQHAPNGQITQDVITPSPANNSGTDEPQVTSTPLMANPDTAWDTASGLIDAASNTNIGIKDSISQLQQLPQSVTSIDSTPPTEVAAAASHDPNGGSEPSGTAPETTPRKKGFRRRAIDWVWVGCAISFLLYSADVITFVAIAVCGIIHERLWPEPGNPHYKPKKSRRPAPITTTVAATASAPTTPTNRRVTHGLDASYSSGTSTPSSVTPRASARAAAAAAAASRFSVAVNMAEQVVPESVAGVPPELLDCYPLGFPQVVIQLPMYNEDSHCERVIKAACKVAWPRDKLLVQANDDSTREDIKRRVDATAADMRALGHQVQVTRRPNNKGFKAGNMNAGLEQLPVGFNPVYVAVLDADFDPPVDFLYQTVWHMEKDPKLAFVQTRWMFANARQNVLTYVQKIGMDFHFAVDQRSRAFIRTFFGFNGTAGVWRYEAMKKAGGWHTDTTVEDMDLTVRAFAAGYVFKYLHYVRCPSELPSTMAAYRSQQYRWYSGPFQVMRKSFGNAWRSPNLTLFNKLSVTLFFFRYFVTIVILLIGTILPALVVVFDEPWSSSTTEWDWARLTVLSASNVFTAFFILQAPLFWPFFVIFMAVTAYHRFYSNLCGMIGLEKSKGWKVTEKTGSGLKGAPNASPEATTAVAMRELGLDSLDHLDQVKLAKTSATEMSSASDEEGRSSAPSESTSPPSRHPTSHSLNKEPLHRGLPTKKPAPLPPPPPPKKGLHAPYMLEILLAVGYLVLAAFAFLATHWMLLVYCIMAAIGLLFVAFFDHMAACINAVRGKE